MPVSDDQKLAMWREVLALCRVQPGENVAVLTGETSLPQNIDMAMRSAARVGWVERSETHHRASKLHDGFRSAQPILLA
jgi:hypothetical protein